MRRANFLVPLLMIVLLGCSKPPGQESDNGSASSDVPFASSSNSITLPTGTTITVKLGQAVGSKISNNGDSFTASIARPVELDGKTVVPAGSEASGHVIEAVPQGRFKGRAVLWLVLDSVTINDNKYDVASTTISRSLKGKGKRTATLIGGGAGGGALIGGLAGGGKGALIGAALGAGAGTAGAAYTGNKEIVLPAESALSFKLTKPLEVK
jgi:hypothetical protein